GIRDFHVTGVQTCALPIFVKQVDGKDLDKNLVGFNPSTFFGTSIGGGNSIKSLSFEIVPDSLIEQKQYYSSDWTKYVNRKLVLRSEERRVGKECRALW